uniref:Uncharacterized protein n=1 Tax=Brassica oleracea var. oleracea TaxID=109376 RepID=A0A0D3C7B5_BRAOL
MQDTDLLIIKKKKKGTRELFFKKEKGLRIPYNIGVADEIERERPEDLEVKSISRIEAVKGGEGIGSGVRATSELWRKGFADRLHHRFEENKEHDDGD